MNRVSCGSRSWVASVNAAPSTLATKRKVERGIAELPQGAIGHLRPEIRPADPDIHDVANALAAMPGPLARAHLVGKLRHPVEDRMNLGDDVLSVDEDFLTAGRAQRHMQHRAVLAHVDLFSREHRVPPRLDSARPGEAHEQANGLVRDAVLRIVEEESGGFDGEPLGAPGVAREQGPQVQIPDALDSASEGLSTPASPSAPWSRSWPCLRCS